MKGITLGTFAASLAYIQENTSKALKGIDRLTNYTKNNQTSSLEDTPQETATNTDLFDNDTEKYAESIIYTGVNMLVSEAIKKIALRHNIPVGNLSEGKHGVEFPEIAAENAKELYKKITSEKNTLPNMPATTDILLDVFATPLAEELLYRYLLPKLLIPKEDEHKIRWDIGILTSYFFGYTHNISAPEETAPDLVKKVIPVNQIGLGLVCHYLSRKAGFSQAFAAHASNNAMAMLIDRYEKFARKNEK